MRRSSFSLALYVFPDSLAYEPVADHENDDRDEEDAHGDPCDVGSYAPRLDEVSPAVINIRAVLDLAQGEDEVLRCAQQQAAQPSGPDHDVCALGGLLKGLQRVTYGDVSIQSHHHHHIGGREHPQDLEMLDDPAEEVRSVESKGDLPAQLWEDLKESHHQIRKTQVLDKQVHARALLLGVAHRQQHAQVPDHGYEEGDAQNRDLYFGHLFVPPERVDVVALVRHGRVCIHGLVLVRKIARVLSVSEHQVCGETRASLGFIAHVDTHA